MNATFYLMRHAKTEWNLARRIQGRSDSPLSEVGENQARGWRETLAGLGLSRILASPLGRTRATAEIVNRRLNLPLEFEPGLMEQDWGEWTGECFDNLCQTTLAAQVALGWDFTPPGGESRRRVLERSVRSLLNAARRHPGQKILVVTHEGPLKCLVYHLLGRDFVPGAPGQIAGYALHEITSENGLRLARTGITL